jgi:uncharacterized protein YciI
MAFYLFKFVPHRPNFMATMTDDERVIMYEHVAYWQQFTDNGTAVMFGPVADPAGGWGVAIVETDDDAEPAAIRSGDPVVLADLGPVDIYPVPNAISRK